MTTPSRGGRPIVVGIESHAHHRLPLAWAADEAARRRLSLVVVHAQGMPTPTGAEGHLPSWQEWRGIVHKTAENTLAEALSFAESRHPDLRVSGLLAEGEPSWVLREQGAEAAMIVLGTRYLSARQELFTSTAVALPVTAHARCPVVVVREWEHALEADPFLVVGVDGSPTSQAAVDFAFEEAALRRARLRAVSVWQRPLLGVLDEEAVLGECRETLYEAVAGRKENHPDVDLHHEVMTGHPVEVLVRESRHALALVTGTRGVGGFAGMLLGSVSQGALHHAQCPVVTVPPSDGRP
ncbi:universal stress protein [Streptomyces inhibens]|uniref:universal stress protein n=1 Tax=Streptomyces inhibens TaxID=2293571 RepID=UPI001EE6F021|nr:universal stress protein [Streptomyces inhibens]UKY47916.1 universal stress protein [Streptomyces inhibens]